MKLWIFILLLFLVIVSAALYIRPQLPIATGYVAKKACSCEYVSERSKMSVKEKDFERFPLNLTNAIYNPSAKSVTSSLLGLYPRTAIYRKGLGCALLQGEDDYHIEKTTTSDYPKTDLVLIDSSSAKLDAAFNLAFDTGDAWEKKTLALLVMKDGKIIKEQYASGINKDTRLLGWSMAKSVCSLLVGIMEKESLLSKEDDQIYPAWENDERNKIRLKDLLHMSSGLEWNEAYGAVSDITKGLFVEENIVKFARSKALEKPIGSENKYSSGTTNIISGYIKRKFESYQDYLAYPHEKLFKPLGLDKPILETDEAGNYVLSSYMWATTRDWAKLGQLCPQKGKWNEEQLIPEPYMDWAIKPSPASKGYVAHIWLNADLEQYHKAPADMYWFGGYDGQYVFVLPSQNMVVVRMGLSKGPPFSMGEVLEQIVR